MLKARIPHVFLALAERGRGKIYSGKAKPCLERNSLATKKTPDIYCQEPNHLNIY
jgi:hypothetical protein